MFTFFLVVVFFVSILAFGGGHSQNPHWTCFWEDLTKGIIKNYFNILCAVFSILKHTCSNVTDRKKNKTRVWKEAALWTGSGWDGWQRWCLILWMSWKRPSLAEQVQHDFRGPVWQRLFGLPWWRGELTQVILNDHHSGSVTMTTYCTLSEYANTQKRPSPLHSRSSISRKSTIYA